jgi:CBS domain containing-hemolysin-like protein
MEPSDLGTTTVFIVLSFLLVLLNAFFVAAEFAIVKVRRTRLVELSNQGVNAARVSLLCVDQLDEYLSATQLGITLVSLALGWIGEESFFQLFVHFAPDLFSEHARYHFVAAGISFFFITMMHVVLGELVPKSMAIQRAERITLLISPPLRLFYRLARPLIHFFTWVANLILRSFGFHQDEEQALSEEELKMVMKESHDEGVISESEAQIIQRAFSFSDKRAYEIMISAEKVQFLSLAWSYPKNIQISQQRMHTRFPLAEKEDLDSVIGVLHMKDLLHLENVSHGSNEALQRAARQALFVEPGMRQDRLLKMLRESRVHLALVRDPVTKRILGIVTMEDILEDLVGEIRDEHGN